MSDRAFCLKFEKILEVAPHLYPLPAKYLCGERKFCLRVGLQKLHQICYSKTFSDFYIEEILVATLSPSPQSQNTSFPRLRSKRGKVRKGVFRLKNSRCGLSTDNFRKLPPPRSAWGRELKEGGIPLEICKISKLLPLTFLSPQ